MTLAKPSKVKILEWKLGLVLFLIIHCIWLCSSTCSNFLFPDWTSTRDNIRSCSHFLITDVSLRTCLDLPKKKKSCRHKLTNGRTDGGTDTYTDKKGQTDSKAGRQLDRWMDGQMDRLMNGQTDGRTDEWRERWTDG
jgi:hypothetical protein